MVAGTLLKLQYQIDVAFPMQRNEMKTSKSGLVTSTFGEC